MFHDGEKVFPTEMQTYGISDGGDRHFPRCMLLVYWDVKTTEFPPYIDVHCHGSSGRSDGISVRCVESSGIDRHAALPSPCSVGRHPWLAAGDWTEGDGRALATLLAREECVALGEVGLDRVHGPTIERQRELLEVQLDVAAGRLPVILHCVRSHADLMQLRKRRNAREPWILHGFTGHAELAGQLLRMGFHLSFGAAVLSAESPAREALVMLPPDRLFLETDESGLDIAVLYRAAATVRGCPVSEMRKIISDNYVSVFGAEA